MKKEFPFCHSVLQTVHTTFFNTQHFDCKYMQFQHVRSTVHVSVITSVVKVGSDHMLCS